MAVMNWRDYYTIELEPVQGYNRFVLRKRPGSPGLRTYDSDPAVIMMAGPFVCVASTEQWADANFLKE